MTHALYMLRLIGGDEPRYVGQTTQTVAERLQGHYFTAAAKAAPDGLSEWLLANKDAIEIVQFDTATAEDATAREWGAIRALSAMGFRLFNVHGSPTVTRSALRDLTATGGKRKRSATIQADGDIRAIRATLGLSQSEFAERLGVTQSTVSRFEAGALPVDRRTLIAAQSLLPTPAPVATSGVFA